MGKITKIHGDGHESKSCRYVHKRNSFAKMNKGNKVTAVLYAIAAAATTIATIVAETTVMDAAAVGITSTTVIVAAAQQSQ